MTVRQFADSRNVTRQAIYQLASKAGKKLSDFTDSKGNLSEEGIAFLETLFPKTEESQEEQDIKTESTQPEEKSDSDQVTLSEMIRILSSSLDKANAQIDRLTNIIEREQALRADDRRRIADLEEQLKLGSGSELKPTPEITIQLDPEGESQEEKASEPDSEKTEEPKTEPEPKREGETAPADPSSSPVTESDQPKPEEKKLSLRQRFRVLFTGKQ